MYLSTFTHNNSQKYGFLTECKNYIVEVVEAEKYFFHDKILPVSLIEVIGNNQAINRFQAIKEKVTETGNEIFKLPISEIRLEAPIPSPIRDIICLGINYREHAFEFGKTKDESKAIPKYPIVFTKATTTVIGTNYPIKNHRNVTNELDYEAELGIIIGKEGTNISKKDAYDYIFGYTIINDVTARDLQRNHSQWFLGKSLDTFCPMGPYLVTADEIPRPGMLEIQCRVNGEIRQHSNTKFLIFDISTIISTISNGITLKPGDIIATGTPKGVGMGFEPPRFLKSGDVVEIEIEKLGLLINPVA